MKTSTRFFSRDFAKGAGVFPWLAIMVFVVYPLTVLVMKSFGISAGSFSFSTTAYMKVLRSPSTEKAIFNSGVTALSVTVISLVGGTTLAWLVVRTDIPGKKLINLLVFISFVIPSYILGLSWIQFTGRNGYLNRILTHFTMSNDYTFQYYSLAAVVVVLSVHLYPIVYFSMCNTLRKFDYSMEQAAIVSGASPLRAVASITGPLALPQILSIGLLVFSRSMANFDVPALLALPIRKDLLPTRIYSALGNLNLDKAAVLSCFLILFSGAVYFMSEKITGKRKYVVSQETAGEIPVFKLGSWKYPVLIVVFLGLFFVSVLPLMVIGFSSFLKRWGLPLKKEYLTLNNYYQLLCNNPQTARAFWNSIWYGTVGASCAVLVAGSIAVYSRYTRGNTGKVLEAIASWPMATPNLVLAVAAILAWNFPPLRLYGTPWVIVVTYMVLFIPLILKNITGLMKKHDENQMFAARLSGASRMRSYIDVVLPFIFPGIRTGWMLCFLIALREIPISLLLYSSNQETLGVVLFGMQSQSYGMEMTSALAMVIIAMIGCMHLVTGVIGKWRRHESFAN